MPTDSTLLLYLFAAYLAAPHWVFTVVRRVLGIIVRCPHCDVLITELDVLLRRPRRRTPTASRGPAARCTWASFRRVQGASTSPSSPCAPLPAAWCVASLAQCACVQCPCALDLAITNSCPRSLQATGVIGLQLGSQKPHFCLVVAGNTLLTETGQGSLLEVLVLFLCHCRQAKASIGGRSLDFLDLTSVAQPQRAAFLLGAMKLKKFFVW